MTLRMAPFLIQDTETVIDRLENARQINAEINRLKSIKETAENEMRASMDAGNKVRQDVISLLAQIKDLKDVIPGIRIELSKFHEDCRSSITETVKMLEELRSIHSEMSRAIQMASVELKKLSEKKEEVHRDIVKENEMMDAKMTDLKVYHGRLLEHFEKFLPGQEIKI